MEKREGSLQAAGNGEARWNNLTSFLELVPPKYLAGSAIYTSGHVLHADPYLVGRHLIVYAATDDYSTVVFRTGRGKIVPVRITAH